MSDPSCSFGGAPGPSIANWDRPPRGRHGRIGHLNAQKDRIDRARSNRGGGDRIELTDASASSGCDLVAAPGGSDAAAGTEAAPLASVNVLLERLQSGQTGCLRAGTYVDRQFVVKNAGVTLTSYPGERATLRGQLRVNYTADGSIAENLNLDGRNVDGLLGPLVYADGFILRGNDITNHHQGICVAVSNYKDLPPTQGVLIENNVIHDCGVLPATNHHHGIYVSHARDTVIRNNVIYGNADRGVQLYPDADDSIVVGNVIDGNGEGVIFGGGPSSSSDDNLVANNVITDSRIRWNVQSHWQGPVGSGNVARDNCVWTDLASTRGDAGEQRDPADDGWGEGLRERRRRSQLCQSGGRQLRDQREQPLRRRHRRRASAAAGPSPASRPPSTPGGGGLGARRRAVLVGGQGRDRLIGGTGSDRLAGRWGPDKIVGGKGGPDCLLGGLGEDRIRSVNGRRDIVKCGSGRDRATVEPKDRVRGCERVRRRDRRAVPQARGTATLPSGGEEHRYSRSSRPASRLPWSHSARRWALIVAATRRLLSPARRAPPPVEPPGPGRPPVSTATRSSVGGPTSPRSWRLRAGETGCLRRGVHELDGVARIGNPAVALTSRSDRPATLVGRLWVDSGARARGGAGPDPRRA